MLNLFNYDEFIKDTSPTPQKILRGHTCNHRVRYRPFDVHLYNGYYIVNIRTNPHFEYKVFWRDYERNLSDTQKRGIAYRNAMHIATIAYDLEKVE